MVKPSSPGLALPVRSTAIAELLLLLPEWAWSFADYTSLHAVPFAFSMRLPFPSFETSPTSLVQMAPTPLSFPLEECLAFKIL